MNRRLPLVTVVVPTYNHEGYVLDCISSILEQDWPNIELIVINDGSTDSTDVRIREFIKKHDCNFIYISKENEGVGRTMNMGLKLAKGEYICEVCSDDLLLPGSIRKRVEYMEKNPATDAVFANGYLMRGLEKTTEPLLGKRKKGYSSSEHTIEDFIRGDVTMVFHTGMFRTSVLRALGGFDQDFFSEDVYMRYLLAMRAKVAYLDLPVLYYRQHATNISKGKPFWMRREKVLAFEKLFHLAEDGRLKRLIEEHLFREYLKYVRAGIECGIEKASLAEALEKALRLRPYSFKARYYMSILR